MVIKHKKSIFFLIATLIFLGAIAAYKSPLAYAIRYHSSFAKVLINLGVCINTRDDKDWTPLGIAIDNGDMDIVRLLIAKGADVNLACIDDSSFQTARTPLMIASNNGNADLVQLLIQHGANVNEKLLDHVENTPLIYASMAIDSEETVRILLANGADINMQNKNGYTALMHAIIPPANIYSDHVFNLTGWEGVAQLGTVNALLDNNADVNIKNWVGDTALMAAIRTNNPVIVKSLLDKGADVNAKKKNSNNALLYAILSKGNNLNIVKLLLDNGANVNDKIGSEMLTPLIYSTRQPNIDILKVLLDKGADVNIASDNNYTALMNATRSNQPEMIKLLLIHDADVNVRDSNGYTALKYATSYGFAECDAILRQYGGKE